MALRLSLNPIEATARRAIAQGLVDGHGTARVATALVRLVRVHRGGGRHRAA
jgi:hypothetical protein